MQIRLLTSTLILALCPALLPSVQAQTIGQPGCAQDSPEINVTTTAEKPTLAAVPGKAVLVLLQNDDLYPGRPRPTSLIGFDGKLVGATHGQTYTVVEVEPGMHHLCSTWKGTHAGEVRGSALHVQLEAGGVYYFEIADVLHHPSGAQSTTLQLIDSDQGELMRRVYDLATLQPKK
jgi:hypothetical protein